MEKKSWEFYPTLTPPDMTYADPSSYTPLVRWYVKNAPPGFYVNITTGAMQWAFPRPRPEPYTFEIIAYNLVGFAR